MMRSLDDHDYSSTMSWKSKSLLLAVIGAGAFALGATTARSSLSASVETNIRGKSDYSPSTEIAFAAEEEEAGLQEEEELELAAERKHCFYMKADRKSKEGQTMYMDCSGNYVTHKVEWSQDGYGHLKCGSNMLLGSCAMGPYNPSTSGRDKPEFKMPWWLGWSHNVQSKAWVRCNGIEKKELKNKLDYYGNVVPNNNGGGGGAFFFFDKCK